MEANRWDPSDPAFGERVRTELARRKARAAAVARACAKKTVAVQLKSHPGETIQVLPATAKGLEKIRQISREGSSSILPAGHKDEDLYEPKVVMLLDQENEIQARLGVEFHKDRYRLSWRLAHRLRMDEKDVQKVLSTVPGLWNQITREKKAVERLVRDIYAGQIEKVQRALRPRTAAAASSNSSKRARKDNGPVLVEL